MKNPENLIIKAVDGYPLHATLFDATAPQLVVVINSAMAVPRRYYRFLAAFFQSQNICALTYDYRGIGDSLHEPVRAFEGRLHEWGEKDMQAVINFAREKYPDLPFALLGHSVGSQLVGICAASKDAKAMIMVSSQSAYWQNWDGAMKPLMFSLWHAVIPAVATIFRFVPGKVIGANMNLPRAIALDWARWGRDPLYIRGAQRRESDRYFEQFGAPILSWVVSDDAFAPKKANDALLAFYENAPQTVKIANPPDAGASIGHMGWFRADLGASWWASTSDWLKQQVGSE